MSIYIKTRIAKIAKGDGSFWQFQKKNKNDAKL